MNKCAIYGCVNKANVSNNPNLENQLCQGCADFVFFNLKNESMACYLGIRKDMSPKCEVANCQNHKHQGKFFGDICIPCYEYIYCGKKDNGSQAWQNSKPHPTTQTIIKPEKNTVFTSVLDAIIITEDL